MSVNLPLAVRTARLQITINAVDANGNGFLRLTDSSCNIVSSFQLSRPSMTIDNGVAKFNGLALIDPAAVGGLAALARLEDAIGNVVAFGLTCGADAASGADIQMTQTIIPAGSAVAITAATITGA